MREKARYLLGSAWERRESAHEMRENDHKVEGRRRYCGTGKKLVGPGGCLARILRMR